MSNKVETPSLVICNISYSAVSILTIFSIKRLTSFVICPIDQ